MASATELAFHPRCGINIQMSEDCRLARRATSYNNGVCFSNRPLEPGEIFTIQIDENETGWEGNLRIGLTSFNPSIAHTIPEFALPNLRRASHCSMTVIRQTIELDSMGEDIEILKQPSTSRAHMSAEICGSCQLHSCLCSRSRNKLISPNTSDSNRLPTDVGSRISIFYTIDNSDHCLPIKVHILINGKTISRNSEPYDELYALEHMPNEDSASRYKPAALPFGALPLFVVIDIYANTKQVHIVTDFDEPYTLQELCRNVIRAQYPNDRQIAQLPCPLPLKYFLRRNEFSPMSPLEVFRLQAPGI